MREPIGGRRRSRSRRRQRGPLRRLVWVFLALVGFAVVLSVLTVVSLRWLDPPSSSFILQRRAAAWADGESPSSVEQHWVPWEAISAAAPSAVVAAEDQRFPLHSGFDVEAIRDALEEREKTGRVRGASTISQQVSKNLFLWPGRSWVRKGLEAYFTVLVEATWPKRRILEVYLNIAQFGDREFGVAAASRRFFGKQPSQLTAEEASLLAAVLPNPKRFRADAPSRYVRERASWIRRQMRMLGPDYLAEL